MKHRLARALLLSIVLANGTSLQARDTPEPGTTEAIRAATTDPRFLPESLALLPDSATVPSPSDHLGRIAGAPGELVDTAQAHAYLRALAAASPRARLVPIGRSEQGREILMLAIADEAGIATLDRLKENNARLADPRTLDAAGAAALLGSSRPFYYLNAGIHADETGSAEAMLELAYRLIVSEEPRLQAIRERLVVLVNPVANPDGRDRVVQWFYRFLKGRTDYAALPRQSPPYWSDYAFVDINRDGHQLVHQSARAVHRMFMDWHPVVIHDLHEAIPLLLSWNGTGPWSPNMSGITISEMLEMSFHEVRALTALGMPGVSTWNFGEGFSQHYIDGIANNHNALGRGYETFGNASAETMQRVLDPDESTREWWRPVPPPPTLAWSARDNANYNQAGVLAALDYSARHADELLMSFYRKSHASWRAGVEESPKAFLIPPAQGDPARVAEMVARLMTQGIEVGRAAREIRSGGRVYPAGTFVVALDQPYRNYALDLLAPQRYPVESGVEPYDDVSWSLPMHYRVEAVASDDAALQDPRLAPRLAEPPAVQGAVEGEGAAFLLADTGQEALLAARYRLAAFRLEVASAAFSAGGRDYPAGSWLLPAQPGLAQALDELARVTGLVFTAVSRLPAVQSRQETAPRLGLWVPWADTDSIGWIRYALDQRHIPYTYVRDEDIRTGAFRAGTDVLLYGHVDLELAEQIHGLPARWGPMPWKKTPATPSHGFPVESEDITGGPGWRGLAELQDWVESGGLLVTLGSGSMLPLEAGIVRGVRRSEGGVPRSSDGGGESSAAAAAAAGTRTPGAHLRASFTDPAHPLAYGYGASTSVYRQNFPLYDTPRAWLRMAYCTSCLDGPPDPSGVVMRWGAEGQPLVASGGAWGEAGLVGRPGILDLPVGKGRVIAFNFNPLHRDLNRGDNRLVWNAVLNWQAILAPRSLPADRR
ncbi:MAG: hypothetical protein FJ171_11770 [Gammaproteobacteria bacterium]|nr:hypothetical protein [Gammaproteobacteria bacterium]